MSEGLERVLRERQDLLARIAAQRTELAGIVSGLDGPAAIVDRGVGVLRYLRSRPVVVGAIVAALAAWRGRGVVSLATRGFGLWQVARRMGRLLQSLRS